VRNEKQDFMLNNIQKWSCAVVPVAEQCGDNAILQLVLAAARAHLRLGFISRQKL